MSWRVFDNAHIYTADAAGTWADAVTVENGRFVAVGSSGAARAAAPPGTAVVDLGGRTVVPGLIDAHNHFLQTSYSLTWVDARYPGVGSVVDLVEVIGRAAASRPRPRQVSGRAAYPHRPRQGDGRPSRSRPPRVRPPRPGEHPRA
jgi:predicted amidohydrolase YtcJ